jgi:ketosteroid isomerase-like protein
MTPKKVPILALAFLLLSLLPLAAQTKPDPAAWNELQRLETVWNKAHLAGDAAALDALWADELVVTVPKMPVFNKPSSLAIWRSGKMKFTKYETSGVLVRTFGDTAIVTGSLVRERTFMDKDILEDWRFTKVYIRRDGRWQVVAWHASERL